MAQKVLHQNIDGAVHWAVALKILVLMQQLS
jgi:hypothetical protein